MDKYYNVYSFINRFTNHNRNQAVIDCFTMGCCYWFAYILYTRFKRYNHAHMVYDTIANHWGCYIDGKVFDITGDVTEKYQWERWDKFIYKDVALTRRLVRDCINFTED